MTRRTQKPQTLTELRIRHKEEEVALVRGALEACGWRASAAARALGIHAWTLTHLMVSLKIAAEYEWRKGPRGRPPSAQTS